VQLRTVKLMATRTAAIAAVAGGGLLLAATAASAATSAAAAPSVAFSSAPVSYTCPMTGFGANLAPLNLAATISVPAQATAGTTVTVKLVTNSMTVPSATATALPAITNLGITGNAAFSGAWQSNANLSGDTALTAAAGALTQIPAVTVTATVTPSGTGQAVLAAPTTITINLTGAGQMAPITCAQSNPVSVPLSLLAAGSAGTGTGATATGAAQAYTCTITTTSGTPTSMNTAMNLGFSGPNAMGSFDKVWLAGALGSQMAGVTPMSASASLGFSGMSTGNIPLSASASGGNLMLAGKWMPQHQGMFRLTAPHRFQVQMRQATTTMVTVVCTATTATTTNTMVNVAANGMSSAAAQGVAAGEGIGSPAAGAPNTGGGGSLHSATDMALVAGGGAALLAGIGIVLFAIRRRGRAISL
jgi:hypothetical protein